MQKCSYCGRENEDAEHFCRECGTALRDLPPRPSAMDLDILVPLRWRIKRVSIACILTLIAMMVPNPSIIVFAMFFPAPLGLILRTENMFPIIVGWLIYAVLVLGSLFAKNKKIHRRFFLIFCILLLINIAGCHIMGTDIHLGC
jgi:hypothetical protein